MERLVAERLAARKSRNFAESDRLRDRLAEMGVKLKDGKDPVTGGRYDLGGRVMSMVTCRRHLLPPKGDRQYSPPDDREKDWRNSLPFPAHWLAYIALKLLVLALVAYFALNYYGLM